MKFQKKLEVFFSNSYKKREKCAVFMNGVNSVMKEID